MIRRVSFKLEHVSWNRNLIKSVEFYFIELNQLYDPWSFILFHTTEI